MQTPTLGRVIMFHNPVTPANEGDPDHVKETALVVGVHGAECVSLVHWNEYGTQSSKRSVILGTAPGQWSWPVFVKPEATATPDDGAPASR